MKVLFRISRFLIWILFICSCEREVKTGTIIAKPSYLKCKSLFPRLDHKVFIDGATDTLKWSNEHYKDYTDTIAFNLSSLEIYGDVQLTIDELEDFLRLNNFSCAKLHETMYWLHMLSRAKLIEYKNKYGDLEGYQAKVGEVNIPSEYFNVLPNLFGENEIQSKSILLGKIHDPLTTVQYFLTAKRAFMRDRNVTEVIFDHPQIGRISCDLIIDIKSGFLGLFQDGELQVIDRYDGGYLYMTPYDLSVTTNKKHEVKVGKIQYQ